MSVSLILLLSFNLFAAETDHYSAREQKLPDMAPVINRKANTYLSQALNEANAVGACDDSTKSEVLLYTSLKKYFANHSKGELGRELLEAKDIAIYIIPLKSSVYQDWSIWNGYLLGRKKAAASPLALAPLVKIGEQVIGTDKLEHMFGMGFRYFNSHYLEGKTLVKVLKKGIFSEKTALGGNVLATGVFSYSDLSANFNGMRFWNHMLQKRDDVLGKEYNIGPYVECKSGKWTAGHPIDFTNYIDASVDESINCSKFANEGGLKKFTATMKRLDENNTCPMDTSVLQLMLKKYGVISHWIINEETNGVVSKLNEF